MTGNFDDIEKLGFDRRLQADVLDLALPDDVTIARVISVNKNNYAVSNGKKDIVAELTGKFFFGTTSPLDYPAVGDWVTVRLLNDDSFAVIVDILPRRSVLQRKTAGNKIDYQLIAANIDRALIVQALDSNYNLRRLERYLVLINEGHIEPVVLLSKSDLASPEEIEQKKSDIRKIAPNIGVISFSNVNAADIEAIKEVLTPGGTFCLLGSSGVGKTTLVNNLMGEELFKTREIREKDERGRHTTTRRELIVLPNGAIIIDNPGMRELGVIAVESGLDETFAEIAELSQRCRFRDCTHVVEKGCAVLNAIEEGVLSKERYNNYIKMRKEASYHEMSYVEKRQKDKQFGKLVRSVLKDKKDKR
jgi:ribosome biogenesis GTPase / thiamine phosphate phosphatase